MISASSHVAAERFIFGVPLIARAAARDWEKVGDLLALTLRSVLAQTDPRFELVLAGHDLPDCWAAIVGDDSRFQFLRAGWTPEQPNAPNDDGGCKKSMIAEHVRALGGGLLMFLDADDLLDRRTVRTARREIGPEHVGGIVEGGVLLDATSLRYVRLPDPRVYGGAFIELCGSSTIARIEPQSPDPVRRDPHGALGSHHRWPEAAEASSVRLARLQLSGAYLVNTGQNHSELQGPFAEWRRQLSAAVRRFGAPLDSAAAAGFGVTAAMLAATSRDSSRRPMPTHTAAQG